MINFYDLQPKKRKKCQNKELVSIFADILPKKGNTLTLKFVFFLDLKEIFLKGTKLLIILIKIYNL